MYPKIIDAFLGCSIDQCAKMIDMRMYVSITQQSQKMKGLARTYLLPGLRIPYRTILDCILYKFADEVEVVSCDEAYISLQGCLPGQGDSCTSVNTKRRVQLFLQHMQTEIHEATGCTASFGVGRNKLW